MVFAWNLTVLTKVLFVLKREKKKGGDAQGIALPVQLLGVYMWITVVFLQAPLGFQ